MHNYSEGQSVRTIMKTLSLLFLLTIPAPAQQGTFQDSLFDHLAGQWVMSGTIQGKETIHDVIAEWVLGHQYMQIHEVSQEKNADGSPAYEATVFIGWDKTSSRYACLWLDVTGGGGLTGQAIGHGKRSGDEIPFLFKGGDGSIFRTNFVYDRNADTWRWLMDGEENGELQSFARLTLTRKLR